METRVARVTVYRNGGLVVRTGHAEPGAVLVTALPLLYAADSLRVRTSAGAIRDLQELARLDGPPAASISENQQALLTLERQLLAIDAKLAAATERLRRAAALRPASPPADAQGLPKAEVLLDLHQLSTTRLREEDVAVNALRQERKALERDRARLRFLLDPTPPRFTRGLSFTLEAPQAAQVEVEYFVPAARWLPTYVLSLDDAPGPTRGRATLHFFARVAQASGEDWTGAELHLATADLSRMATLPELTSWRIGPREPPRRPAFRPLPTDLEALFAGFDQGADSPNLPTARVSAAPPPPPPPCVQPTEAPCAKPSRCEEEVDEFIEFNRDDDALECKKDLSAKAKKAECAPPAPMRNAPGRGGALPSASQGCVSPPTPELSPRLRHAYLRLRGADEPGRGTLTPIDPISHLAELLAHETSDAPGALRRAVAALEDAAARLRAEPLSLVLADGYQWVHPSEGLHDIPSDGAWHRIPINTYQTPAITEYRGVPRESLELHRHCLITLKGGLPLPSGPLQVFVDGRYRVTTTLNATGGGTPLTLNLGVEPAVKVLDRIVQTRQQEKGLVSSATTVEHTVTTRLRSSLSEPVTVILFDRLPVVAREERDLSVALLESQPELQLTDRGPTGASVDGGVQLVLTLPPGETVTASHRYRLTYPSRLEIIGGREP